MPRSSPIGFDAFPLRSLETLQQTREARRTTAGKGGTCTGPTDRRVISSPFDDEMAAHHIDGRDLLT